jgi:AraC family transcriptional regulator of adaptative response / DNA-3-methyladenine glycosylase II
MNQNKTDLGIVNESQSMRLGITRIFPTPDRIARANLLGMPAARAQALSSVAAAASANPNFFSPSQTLEDAIAKLRSIRGIGEWTAQYIAMRVL